VFACAAFFIGEIDEAFKGRCGAPTKQAIEDRAEALGLLKNTTEACGNDNDYIRRLQILAGSLRARGAEHGRMEADAVEWLLEKLTR